MTHVSKATLVGTNVNGLDGSDSPAGGVGSRFMSFVEPGTAERFNRAFSALSDNGDEHETELTRELAVPVVGVLTLASPSGSFTIGSGGDIDITSGAPNYQDLYMGRSTWADNQENRDHLFEILDSDYNEAIVDTVEAKAVSFTGAAVGDQFVDVTSGTVTVTLNVTLPAGSYRIGFFADSMISTLEEDAFVSVSIRGLNEAPSESAFKGAYICAIDTTDGPADFVGANAVQNALAALGDDTALFLRPGEYTLAETGGGTLDINQANVTIQGSSSDPTNGVRLIIDTGSAHNFLITGDNVSFRNLHIKANTAGTGQFINVAADFCSFKDCGIEDIYLLSSNDYGIFDQVRMSAANSSLLSLSGDYWSISSSMFSVSGTIAQSYIVRVAGSNAAFSACRFVAGTASLQWALEIPSGKGLHFSSCHFETTYNSAFIYGQTSITDYLEATFTGCTFVNAPSNAFGNSYGPIMPKTVDVAQAARLLFVDCAVSTTNISTNYYQGPFVQLLARSSVGLADELTQLDGSIVLENVRFYDVACKGVLTETNPDATTTGSSATDVLLLRGVSGSSIVFNRDAVEYDIQDSSWISLQDSNITSLRVVYGVNEHPFQLDTGLTPVPLVSCQSASTITDLHFVGFLGKGSIETDGDWKRPLLQVLGNDGGGIGPDPAWPRRGLCRVDGLIIQQLDDPLGSYPHEWEFSYNSMIEVECATLSRFQWNELNKLCYVGGSGVTLGRLVTLSNKGVFQNNSIRHFDGAGITYGGLLDYVVYLTVSDEEMRVLDNDIYVTDPVSADIGMLSVINGVGVKRCVISENNIKCNTSVPSGAGAMINLSGTSEGNRVCNNHMQGPKATAPVFVNYGSSSNVQVGNHMVNANSGNGAPTVAGTPTEAGNLYED